MRSQRMTWAAVFAGMTLLPLSAFAGPDLIAILTHPMSGKVVIRNIGDKPAKPSVLTKNSEANNKATAKLFVPGFTAPGKGFKLQQP